jgi:putative transposase
MPRANRYFIPGHIWHITHRCHKQEFLLKFVRDRKKWISWLYEAKKRFGLVVFNYTVTSNHIHLLVRDTGEEVIPKSMQLIAGKVAQQYNHRKKRKGAFWEDRYHATAVDSGEHLFRCLVYIDMNMVRAGVAMHPHDWATGGYQEIQSPRDRYSIIDQNSLSQSLTFNSVPTFQKHHRQWIDEALRENDLEREAKWSQSLAVGSEAFVNEFADAVNPEIRKRRTNVVGESFVVREPSVAYSAHFDSKMDRLSTRNTFPWQLSPGPLRS